MAAKTTLKYIAERLHLSISTVSRALKDHPDISASTKKKVVELANLIEYEPNTYAISLRTNSSKLFAIILPSLSNNNFYDSFLSSVEEDARLNGYSLLILQSADDPAIETENLRLARINRVAGVFVALCKRTKELTPFRKLEDLGIPVVFFDKVPDAANCDKVCVADEDAARLAAGRLVVAGKKHILAVFGNPYLQITRKRAQIFQQQIQQANQSIQLEVAYADSFLQAQQTGLDYLQLPDQPDAIFCMSDEILTGIMKAVQQTRLQVPVELGILSISNDGFIPGLYEPSITYVETSGYKLGKLAFQRMQDHLAGKKFYRELTIESVLVEGGSL